MASIRRPTDTAEDTALEVRSHRLELAEVRWRIPVNRRAIELAEENTKVLFDRYRDGLSTVTQVLDAESLRVQTFLPFGSAVFSLGLAFLGLALVF